MAPTTSQLQYRWYLEPNEIANRALAQLLPEEEMCMGIPGKNGTLHDAWGSHTLERPIGEILARSERFRGASITVLKRSPNGAYVTRVGVVSIP